MIQDTVNGGATAEVIPLDEAGWTALETGTARLLPGSGAAPDLVARLFASVVGEYRCLHRDLALYTRAPASFRYKGQAIVRTMRVVERSLRAGQEVTAGAWRLGREDGRGDDAEPFSQYTISHAAGGSGKRQTSLVIIRRPGAPPSSFYPLPFDAAVLEESDVTGRSMTLAIERDESDAVFVGCLTMLRDKPTGSPTDFGVLLKQDGTQEWSGGSLARQTLLESARLAAEGRGPVDQASAQQSPPPASPRPTAAEAAPETVHRPASRRRRSGAVVREEPNSPRATCRKCGASLAAGARFCASCGESATRQAAPAVAPAPRAPARCRKCGAALAPDVRFCSACGAPTAAPARPTECARCGAALRPDARFCASCGTAVGDAAATKPRAPTCASCGAELRPGARFCRRCGTAQT